MAWTKPNYSRKQIDWAGEKIATLADPLFFDSDYFLAEEIVNNWRGAHSYPLQVLKMTLKRRARKVCENALVAQRLKRFVSIRLKLRIGKLAGQHPNLSQMQDLGGCRAILDSVEQVRKVEAMFLESNKKNPKRGPHFQKKYDYIAAPKKSGYRSVHLIYRFRSSLPEHSCYNGQRIEIQLRTRLQHYWATAVETYSTFSGEALKSNIGSARWMRFFALMSSALALKEQCMTVPDTGDSLAAFRDELKHLYKELNVYRVLSGWSAVTRHATITGDDTFKKAHLYLLKLNPDEFVVYVTAYNENGVAQAQQDYADTERNEKNVQAVLVSADSIAGLHAAYPNYFLDTSAFLNEVSLITTESIAPSVMAEWQSL